MKTEIRQYVRDMRKKYRHGLSRHSRNIFHTYIDLSASSLEKFDDFMKKLYGSSGYKKLKPSLKALCSARDHQIYGDIGILEAEIWKNELCDSTKTQRVRNAANIINSRSYWEVIRLTKKEIYDRNWQFLDSDFIHMPAWDGKNISRKTCKTAARMLNLLDNHLEATYRFTRARTDARTDISEDSCQAFILECANWMTFTCNQFIGACNKMMDSYKNPADTDPMLLKIAKSLHGPMYSEISKDEHSNICRF